MKKKILILLIVLIIIFSLSGIVLLNQKRMFIKSLNTNLDYIIKLLETEQTSGELSLKSNSFGGASVSDINVISIINDISLNLNYGVDFKNKVANIEFNTNYKNNSIQTGKIYINNDRKYLLLDYIIKEYIELDLSNYPNLKLEYKDNLEKVLISLKEVFNTTIKDINIKPTKEKVDDNILLCFNISDDLFNKIKSKSINLLENDKDFIKNLSNILEIEEDELQIRLNELNNKTKNYNITYYKGRLFNDTQIIKISNKQQEFILKYQKQKYSFKYSINNSLKYKGYLERKNNSKYELSFENQEKMYTANLEIDFKKNFKTNNKKENTNNSKKYTIFEVVEILKNEKKFEDILYRYDNRKEVEAINENIAGKVYPSEKIEFGIEDS